jgi:hypothetical protein
VCKAFFITIILYLKRNTVVDNSNLLFPFCYALRIEVEILLVAERVEAKKDCNEKPDEPFGENTHIFFKLLLFFVLKQRIKIQGCIKSC